MRTNVTGETIPKIRHVSGPCWNTELGGVKKIITRLHERSKQHGWQLYYWSHEAMDVFMNKCEIDELRRAYFNIRSEYRAAKADLFRIYVLFIYGGIWLDLRGFPRNDPDHLGLETIPRMFKHGPPPLLFSYAGLHKKKFNNEFGEIRNGFLMSSVCHPIWTLVWKRVVTMIKNYPLRWRAAAASCHVRDTSRTYYSADCDMTGREAVLCQGPLAMTAIVYPYLRDSGGLETSLPDSFQEFFKWETLPNYQEQQGLHLYRDAGRATEHLHYSKLTTPVVIIPVDQADDSGSSTSCASSAGKSASEMYSMHKYLFVSDSVLQLGSAGDESWLDSLRDCVIFDIRGGRTFRQHPWTNEIKHGKRFYEGVVFCASNDCMEKERPKHHLNPWSLKEGMKDKLTQLSQACDKLRFVLVGDCHTWKTDPRLATPENQQHFAYCQRQQLETAKSVPGIEVEHWIDADLKGLPVTEDGRHFDSGAASSLMKRLLHLLDVHSTTPPLEAGANDEASVHAEACNWIELWSDEHNASFFYNSVTDESVWTLDSSPWSKHWCHEQNRLFYFNRVTRESVWTLSKEQSYRDRCAANVVNSATALQGHEPSSQHVCPIAPLVQAVANGEDERADSADRPVTAHVGSPSRASLLFRQFGDYIESGEDKSDRCHRLFHVLWDGNFALRDDVAKASRPDDAKDKLERLFADALAVRKTYHGKSKDILSDEDLLRLQKEWIDDVWHAQKPEFSWLNNVDEDELNEVKKACFEKHLTEAETCEIFFMPLVANPFVEDGDNAQRLITALLQIPLLSPGPSGCEAKRRRKS
jgi:hypothetical protein